MNYKLLCAYELCTIVLMNYELYAYELCTYEH